MAIGSEEVKLGGEYLRNADGGSVFDGDRPRQLFEALRDGSRLPFYLGLPVLEEDEDPSFMLSHGRK